MVKGGYKGYKAAYSGIQGGGKQVAGAVTEQTVTPNQV